MPTEQHSSTAQHRHIRNVEQTGPLTVYYLSAGLSREQRLQVLTWLRARHPHVSISMIGDEIAIGGTPWER